MKKFLLVLICASLPFVAEAKGGKVNRGGLGFLFVDSNSAFENPAQFAMVQGFSAEAIYGRQTGSESQLLAPSFVYGHGKVGFGVQASRAGTSLTDTDASQDSIGGGLGIMLGQRVSLGASYVRSVDVGQMSDGEATGSINFNAMKSKGVSFGGSFATSVNAAIDNKNARGYLGYTFSENSNLEGGVIFNDLDDTSDYSGQAAFTTGNKNFYLGARYTYNFLPKDHTVGGRLGFILGGRVDLSGFAEKTLVTGSEMTYGGSLRALF